MKMKTFNSGIELLQTFVGNVASTRQQPATCIVQNIDSTKLRVILVYQGRYYSVTADAVPIRNITGMMSHGYLAQVGWTLLKDAGIPVPDFSRL